MGSKVANDLSKEAASPHDRRSKDEAILELLSVRGLNRGLKELRQQTRSKLDAFTRRRDELEEQTRSKLSVYSETVREQMIELFPLLSKENVDSREDVEKAEEGLVQVERTARAPERASKIPPVKKKEERLLPRDTYSFFATAKYFRYNSRLKYYPSLPLVIAIFVLILQGGTLALLAIDVINCGDENHTPFCFPAGVERQVRISQLVALFITAICQDEVMLSLNVMYYGYDAEAQNLAAHSTSSWLDSCCKWWISALLRFIIGLTSLFVSFILIMQEDTVRGLLLTFMAIKFISDVDNAVFLLAKWGYFCGNIKAHAVNIARAKRNINEGLNCTTTGRQCARSIVLMAIGLALFACWLLVSVRQAQGRYVSSKQFYVQFGDETAASIGMFSGLYTLADEPRSIFGERVSYILSYPGNYDGSARFAYCRGRKAWTFAYGLDYSSLPDPCDYRARSSESRTFDITDTLSQSWFVRDINGNEVPLHYFSLRDHNSSLVSLSDSKECQNDEGCNGDFLVCERGVCVCKDGRSGSNCQFRAPCDSLEIDPLASGFSATDPWSERYDVLRDVGTKSPVQFFRRPIYLSKRMGSGSYDVIFFTGRRWILTRVGSDGYGALATEKLALTDLADLLPRNFHPYWDHLNASFISEPVDVAYAVDTAASPVGLNWFHAKGPSEDLEGGNRSIAQFPGPDLIRPSSAVLICAVCDAESNPCSHGGHCGIDGKCLCENGASGTLCRITPDGNGQCNPFFNTAEYHFDGGDCCWKTCESPEEHSCGSMRTLFRTKYDEFIGYPHCKDPSQLCNPSEKPCWNRLNGVTFVSTDEEDGRSMVLSKNGQVLAVHDAGIGRVMLFEQNGSQWVRRQSLNSTVSALSDLPSSSSIALSEKGDVVAFGHSPNNTAGTIDVFEWSASSSRYIKLGQDTGIQIKGRAAVDSIALSSDGTVLAFSYRDVDVASSSVQVYRFNPETNWTDDGLSLKVNGSGSANITVSLSGDGMTIALGYVAGNRSRVSFGKYSSENTTWDSLPERDIEGPAGYLPITSLSSNGTIVAVGGRRVAVSEGRTENHSGGAIKSGFYVPVYGYSTTDNNTWTQLGQSISFNTEWYDDKVISVSLSSDGTILAVGESGYENNGNNIPSGITRVYKTDEWNQWQQLGRDIDNLPLDHSGHSVSLSGDGDVLAIGASRDSFERGHVELFWNPEVQPTSSVSDSDGGPISESVDPLVPVTIELRLESHPQEIGLRFACNDTTDDEAANGTLIDRGQTSQESFYVHEGSNCELNITDSAGDGINGTGFVKVFADVESSDINKLLYYDKDQFGSNMTFNFIANGTVCPNDEIPLHLELSAHQNPEQISWSVSNGNKTLFGGGPYNDTDGPARFIERECIRNDDCVVFAIVDKAEGDSGGKDYSLYLNGVKVATGGRFKEEKRWVGNCNQTIKCDTKSTNIQVNLTTDAFPDETEWELAVDGALFLQGGPYTRSGKFVRETCVPSDSCAVFAIHDAGGDGICCGAADGRNGTYAVLLDGNREEFVGDFGFSAKHRFGNCADLPNETLV